LILDLSLQISDRKSQVSDFLNPRYFGTHAAHQRVLKTYERADGILFDSGFAIGEFEKIWSSDKVTRTLQEQ